MKFDIHTTKERLDTIVAQTPETACLYQLAEEASELAQAALKLARIKNRVIFTPVSEEEAFEHLNEELADVLNCFYILTYVNGRNYDVFRETVERISCGKLDRWARRIKEQSDGKVA